MERSNFDNVIPRLIGLLPYILGAVITLIIGFIIANAVAKIVKKILRKSSTDETIVSFSGYFISGGLKIMTLMAALGFFGIETSSSFLPILFATAFVTLPHISSYMKSKALEKQRKTRNY